jgi:hypothetical protein
MKLVRLAASTLGSALAGVLTMAMQAQAVPIFFIGPIMDTPLELRAKFGHVCPLPGLPVETSEACALRFGNPVGTLPVNLSISGAHWEAELTVNERNRAIPSNIGPLDIVTIQGTIRHITNPHVPPEEVGPFMRIGIIFDALGEFSDLGRHVEVPHLSSKDHRDIADILDISIQRNRGDIISWNVTVRGFHDPPPAPEPAAVLLFGLGALGLCGWLARQRGRA